MQESGPHPSVRVLQLVEGERTLVVMKPTPGLGGR
jgi:hypothetical protein